MAITQSVRDAIIQPAPAHAASGRRRLRLRFFSIGAKLGIEVFLRLLGASTLHVLAIGSILLCIPLSGRILFERRQVPSTLAGEMMDAGRWWSCGLAGA